jgi:hypothetical protein
MAFVSACRSPVRRTSADKSASSSCVNPSISAASRMFATSSCRATKSRLRPMSSTRAPWSRVSAIFGSGRGSNALSSAAATDRRRAAASAYQPSNRATSDASETSLTCNAFGAGAGGDRVEIAERLHRSRHRLLAEILLLVYVGHEPQRRARSGDQTQMAGAVAVENDHAAGVRADVDDRDRGCAARRTLSHEGLLARPGLAGFATQSSIPRRT